MKTNFKTKRNNLQQAILKTLAVAASFALLSITVNAQDFWRSVLENEAFGEIAMAMGEPKIIDAAEDLDNTLNAGYYSHLLESETETDLAIENWMTDVSVFGNDMAVTKESGTTLELEVWMTDTKRFSRISWLMENDNDGIMEIEGWMLDEQCFEACPEKNGKNFVSGDNFVFWDDDEYRLEFEDWMFDVKIFEGR